MLGWYTVWSPLPLVSFIFVCPILLALHGLLHMLSAHLLCSLHFTHALCTLQAFPRQLVSAEGTGQEQAPDAGGLCLSCGLVSGKPMPSLVGTLFILPFLPLLPLHWVWDSLLFCGSSSSGPPGSAPPLHSLYHLNLPQGTSTSAYPGDIRFFNQPPALTSARFPPFSPTHPF